MISNNKYFKKSKIISLDTFFEDVLYNKNYGYYSKKDPFEKKGDFITSPSISFLFSEMIAVWIILMWKDLGKPKKFNIVELGPGNGNLSKTLIKTFKCFPEFYKVSQLYLYEKSAYLKKIQKKKLNNKKVSWISNFNKIKKGPVIFFGNEFFDALPIKQFKIKNKILYEKFVYQNNKYQIKELFKKAKKNDELALKEYKILKNKTFIEYPKKGLLLLNKIIAKFNKLNGGLLLIDYGYSKKNNLNTLQSVKQHKRNELYKNLGEADITSLVNFNLLKNYFLKKKLNVENIVTQSFFLKKMGILERAEILSKNMNFKKKSDIYMRIKRLLHPEFMGELFKVIFAFKLKKRKIIGFN